MSTSRWLARAALVAALLGHAALVIVPIVVDGAAIFWQNGPINHGDAPK